MVSNMVFPDAMRLEALESLCALGPVELVQKLAETGQIDAVATEKLRELISLQIFHFRFHPIRCAETPLGPHYTKKVPVLPWQRAGNVWLWSIMGEPKDGSLYPTSEPTAIWLEICLA